MNILVSFACLSTATLLALVSCSGNPSNNKNTETEHHHHHDGHDHDDHNHEGHDHKHDHAPIAAENNAGNESNNNGTTEQKNTEEIAPAQAAPAATVQAAPSAVIPAFNFYKVKSGISFTEQDIPKGKKTVFILFDPSCPHCRTEANALALNYKLIKDINLYFVSMNDPALMASFLETFAKELANKPNVQMLYDKNQEFIQKFHVPKQFPANYVYSKEGKLEAFWDGDRNIKDIIAAYTK